MNLTDPLSAEFTGRMVTLCDGRTGLRSGLQVEIEEPPITTVDVPANPTLDFVASSESLDRYDEILSASGWRLENYRRNPVFQNAHQYGDIIFTLGKALITEVRTMGARRVLFQRVEFATAANPLARIAYGLYQGRFLNAVSVGFIPIRWEIGDEQSDFRRKFIEQELLEVSAVGIPANPEALALGLKSGAVHTTDLRELVELVRSLEGKELSEQIDSLSPHRNFSDPADPNTHARASGVRSYEAQLLQLARDAREALKL
jgi:HK97 family phage prohead protease